MRKNGPIDAGREGRFGANLLYPPLLSRYRKFQAGYRKNFQVIENYKPLIENCQILDTITMGKQHRRVRKGDLKKKHLPQIKMPFK